MDLWNGTYPDNKYIFGYHHTTAITTQFLPHIIELEYQAGDDHLDT